MTVYSLIDSSIGPGSELDKEFNQMVLKLKLKFWWSWISVKVRILVMWLMCGHKPISKLNESLKFEELNDSASCYLAPPLVNCSDEKFLSADLETKDSDPLFWSCFFVTRSETLIPTLIPTLICNPNSKPKSNPKSNPNPTLIPALTQS